MVVNTILSEIELAGFKSIKRMRKLKLDNLNILIGANGSGKTNFVSFFKMLQFYLNNRDGLSEFVNKHGGASGLLHYGSKITDTISAKLTITTPSGENNYSVEFGIAQGDSLYFKDEKVSYTSKDRKAKSDPIHLGSGGKESRLLQVGENDEQYDRYSLRTIKTIKSLMQGMSFYQFHDTTPEARIRGASHINDNQYLRSDAGNLPSFLRMLGEKNPRSYNRILDIARQIAPYIGDITIGSEYDSPYVKLKWNESVNLDYSFDAGQMSDGSLRAIALVTLLSQPKLPAIICIDEPELGLHPEAIAILADLLKCASETSQIIISTQSSALVDFFEPENIIVVDRIQGETQFNKLEYDKYKPWLEEYSLSQIWNANIFGGRP